MGAYSEDYVCVPYQNNTLWIPIVFLQFVVIFAALASHSVFFILVIRCYRFGAYLRFCFFNISFMMVIMILTSTGAFLITLANGKYIEDCEISSIESRKWLLYMHSFGEYFFVVCEVLGTAERWFSTYYQKQKKSKTFKFFFVLFTIGGICASIWYIIWVRIAFIKWKFAVGFGSLTCLEIGNGIAVFWLMSVTKKKYLTQKEASLGQKFEVYQAYAYSRCAVGSVIARIVIITYVYMKIGGLFEGDLDSPFFYFMNLLINLYCTVYPWTIMLCHRKVKSEIKRFLRKNCCIGYPNRIRVTEEKSLYTIDGKRMNTKITLREHFHQLDKAWNQEPDQSSARPN